VENRATLLHLLVGKLTTKRYALALGMCTDR